MKDILKKDAGTTTALPLRKWRCTVCGYEYEGTELPEDYICPLCGASAEFFEEITD